ncbi:MAG: protein translocase subunit SecF [Methanomicrobiales archaeon]|nr:protein translocase subunit SecF [Methanomicrobiales archaeon]
MVEFQYNIARFSPWQLVAGPVVVLILCIGFLSLNIITTGLPITPGIDFAGGTAVTLFTQNSGDQIRTDFSSYPLISVAEGINNGWYLKFGPMTDDQYRQFTAYLKGAYPDSKVDQIGETFGKTLQSQAVYALLFSFIGMAVVVFVAFRTLVPAGAVVLSAFADIAMTAVAMQVLGIPLSLGTTAALLMLVGYSVDSDILLTTRVLKRKGKTDEKFTGAFRTGFIMTTTTMAAVGAMWVVSVIGSIQIITEIAAVLLLGLFFDLFNTWLTNAGLLKWYVEKRGER